jgi:WD40 repeat protein
MVSGATFAPDGRRVATWQMGGVARIWRLPATDRAAPAATRVNHLLTFKPSRDGKRAIAGRFINPYADVPLGHNLVRVYDLDRGVTVGPGVALADQVEDTALSSRGDRAAAVTTGPNGAFLHVWDVMTGALDFAPCPLAGSPLSVDFRRDDALVAALSREGAVRIFDTSNGHLVSQSFFVSSSSPDRNAKLQFGALGTLVALRWGQLLVLDDRTGNHRYAPIPVHTGSGFSTTLAVSNDGRYVASDSNGPNEHTVRVYDLATGAPVSPALYHPDVPFKLVFTPDGRRLLTGGRDGQLRVWDYAAGTLASPPCRAHDEIYDFAVLPGAKFAVTGVRRIIGPDERDNFEIWDLASGKRAAPGLGLKGESVNSLAVAGAGRRALAYASPNSLYEIDLSDLFERDSRASSELVRLGELASGQRVVGGDLTGLTTEEWLARWRAGRPRFSDEYPPAPAAPELLPIVDHPRPGAPPPAGWRQIARERLERLRSYSGDSEGAISPAVYALLDGDSARYQEACRIMLELYGRSEKPEDAERTAKICLLGDVMRDQATRLVERMARSLDAGSVPPGFAPWGFSARALAALRNGRPADAVRYSERGGAFAPSVRAMAEQQLGRHTAALASLAAARQSLGSDGAGLINRLARDPFDAERNNPYLHDQLIAAILLREAEAAVMLDPTFPAEPFARGD